MNIADLIAEVLEAGARRARELAAEMTAATPDAEPVFTLDQAAQRRNLSASTLRSWAKSGRLPTRRGARNAYLCTDADIDTALATQSDRGGRGNSHMARLAEWEERANAELERLSR